MTTPTTGAAELPEALRLAADLSSIFISEEIHATKARKIAAELRRLCQSEREGWRYADELKQDLDRLHAQVEALSAAQAGAPVIPAMMYLMLTDAMGYDSGEDGTTWSPEEWAAHLYSFYKSKTAPAQPGQEGEREAFIRWYMEYLHTDEMLAAYVWDNEHIVPQTWRAARAAPQPATADALDAMMLDALKHAQKVLNHHNLPLECGPINEAILAAQREVKP